MERAVFVAELERLPPPGEPFERLYLGSESCVWRLPSAAALAAALDAAAARGAGFSLVTPFLDEPGLERTLALVRSLPPDPAVEVVVNDLGLLELLAAGAARRTLVAGRLLTRQRRGPGFQSFGEATAAAREALRGSALDSPAFVELLAGGYGVRRFELDDLVQGVSVPDLPPGVALSLYRPYLLVTATRNCPWAFDGRAWRPARGCAAPCRGGLLRLASTADDAACLTAGKAEGWREAGALLLGGCAQYLEHRSDAPPPPGVDRIVWQPEVPA